MKNILKQANFSLPENTGYAMGGYSQMNGSEKALATKAFEVAGRVQDLGKQKAYGAALELVATIRPEVDAFFEQVMVMDPDAQVRERRLMLLAMIVRSFSGIADFSEIVVAG
jgi:glycyl-tRNA synthetase beta chain